MSDYIYTLGFTNEGLSQLVDTKEKYYEQDYSIYRAALDKKLEVLNAESDYLEASEKYRIKYDLNSFYAMDAAEKKLDRITKRAPRKNPFRKLFKEAGLQPLRPAKTIEMAAYEEEPAYVLTLSEAPDNFGNFLALVEKVGFRFVGLEDDKLQRPFKQFHPEGLSIAIATGELGLKVANYKKNYQGWEKFSEITESLEYEVINFLVRDSLGIDQPSWP